MRFLAVEGCAALGELLEPADCIVNILPVIGQVMAEILEVFNWWQQQDGYQPHELYYAKNYPYAWPSTLANGSASTLH